MSQTPSLFRKETNFRDIGGYPSAYGGTVRTGVFFRSAAPGLFLPEEQDALRGLGIRTVIDLRSRKKSLALPDPEIDGIRNIQACAGFERIGEDLNYSLRELWSMIRDEDQHGNLASVLVSSYFAALAYSNDAYKIMFREILEGNVPMLVHCSQGKDRTGIAAILILLVLGVPETYIMKDFLLSNEYREQFLRERLRKAGVFAKMSRNLRTFLTALEGSLPESAHMFMAEILERYDDYPTFFEKEYGLTPEQQENLRALYLEQPSL